MSDDPPPVALPVAAEANLQPLPQSAEPPDVTHVTREVKFFHRRTPIVYQKSPGPCPLFAIWELVDNFLKINETQITAYGICCLHKDVKDDELCVLFRNDHFNTMFKHNGRLYLLANAHAFVDQKDVTWESLELSGAGQLFTSDFMPIAKTPRNDSWQEQAAMSIDSFAQADNTSGGIPSADPTDDKMTDMLNEQCLSRAHGSKLLAFDALVANGFIVKKEWEALDDYLGKFLATVLKKTPDEVVMMHPGLFMIPRMERLLDMLSDQNFEEANSFYQSSIALLRGCQGRYIPLDLVHNIDVLYTGVKRRYWSKKRETLENILNIVSGYIHVYFRRDDGKADGLWQFAKRFPKPTKMVGDKKKNYHPFMCLLCGWSRSQQFSSSHLRAHLLKSQETKICPKVTEEVLDRLRALNLADVPTFEDLKATFNGKKNKRSIVSWVTTSGTSKKPRPDYSQSLDSLPSLSHQLQISHESTQSDKDTNNRFTESELPVSVDTSLASQMKPVHLSLPGQSVLDKSNLPGPSTNRVTNPISILFSKLLEESSAIRSRVSPDVESIYDAFIELQFAIMVLKPYARPNDMHPEPEKLSSLVDSLAARARHFNQCITPSIVPNKEDRSFLKEKLAAVNELIISIPY